MNNIGLYIHIPFCKKKCAYCDFYSICDRSLEEKYIERLSEDIKRHAEMLDSKKRLCDSIFIGGGTPSILSVRSLDKLLLAISSIKTVEGDTEFSIEANPATLDDEKLSLLSKGGVNRLSIGLQSADDNELSALSRIHTFGEFLKTYNSARRYFYNINVDIMYGLPKQSLAKFMNTVDTVISLDAEHISMYGLRVEENTPFGRMKDTLSLPDEDGFAEMYLSASERLRGAGYEKYEISNFSKPGKECRHNLKYWTRAEYVGIGPAAHSFFEGKRYFCKSDINAYIEKIPCISDTIDVSSKNSALEEEIMLSLRLKKGLDTKRIFETYGVNILSDFGDAIYRYVKEGFARLEGDVLSLTDKGMLVSNYIISDILY